MFLDESIEAIEKMNSTRHKSRGGEAHKDRVFNEDSVLNRITLAEKLKEKFISMVQKEFENIEKKDTVGKGAVYEGDWAFYKPSNLFGGEKENKKVDLTDDFIKAATDRREEAYKENNGKIDYSEIDFDIIDLMARRFNVNKHKYQKGNMLKPIDENQLLMALYRHWRKMFQPVPNDEETFEEHLAAILCNAQMIYQQRKLKNS